MFIDQSDLDRIDGPKYHAIVHLIEEAMRSGALRENDRLPPQRELAKHLGVTVGTITRAFLEAESKGLVRGEVGRGTYVIPNEFTSPSSFDDVDIAGNLLSDSADDMHDGITHEDHSIFERTNLPYDCVSLSPIGNSAALIESEMAALQQSDRFSQLFDYTKPGFLESVRESIAQLLSASAIHTTKDNIVVTCGAQHSLSIATAGLSEPGDIIVTEALSYQGIQSMATRLHRRQVIGVDMDSEGIIPENLEKVCSRYKPKLLITVPNHHNPTGITVPKSRRRAIADIAKRFNLIIIEDDVNHHLLASPPPTYYELLPQQTCYINSLSKSISPGLRIGFLVAPFSKVMKLRASLRSSVWMVPPLLAILGKKIIDGEMFSEFHQRERSALVERNQIARRYLGEWMAVADGNPKHIWLNLPEGWTAIGFTEAAQQQGIAILPSWLFAIDRNNAPEAVRISLSGIKDTAMLTETLKKLSVLISNPEPTSE